MLCSYWGKYWERVIKIRVKGNECALPPRMTRYHQVTRCIHSCCVSVRKQGLALSFPIIDPLRKARADPLRGRRGYRLAPRFVYRGQTICFNSFNLFCVILYYKRIYLHEWYTKKKWLFCFIINLTKLDLYSHFGNLEFRYLSRNQTASWRLRRIHALVLQQNRTNPVHTLTPL